MTTKKTFGWYKQITSISTKSRFHNDIKVIKLLWMKVNTDKTNKWIDNNQRNYVNK